MAIENFFDVLNRFVPSVTVLLAVGGALLGAVMQIFASVATGKFWNNKEQKLEPAEMLSMPKGIVKGDRSAASISASLLQEYHAQGLSQSRVSFWFSIIFASIGFAIIAMSIGLFAQQQIGTSSAGWLDAASKPVFTLISGVIIEAGVIVILCSI